MEDIVNTAKALVVEGKGILAADESFPTIEKRFKSIGIESTHENRTAYRKLLFETPGIEEFISGIILFEETLKDNLLVNPNIIKGIKVDEGLKDMPGFPGDKVTEGLDSLATRLVEYKNLGAKFAKWRAAFSVTIVNPSIQCVEENSKRLAEYASICQANGIVPIVEPEILMDGAHTIDKCYEITRSVLKLVFMNLRNKNINFSSMLLKPNMILPGTDSPKASPQEVAQKTLEILNEVVPKEVPGIVFLSGGQEEEEATANLQEINRLNTEKKIVPFALSFSYGRALQNSALTIWSGKSENIKLAQDTFYSRAKMNSLATYGK